MIIASIMVNVHEAMRYMERCAGQANNSQDHSVFLLQNLPAIIVPTGCRQQYHATSWQVQVCIVWTSRFTAGRETVICSRQ